MAKNTKEIQVELLPALLERLQKRIREIDIEGVTVERLAAVLLAKWLEEDGVIPAKAGDSLALQFFANYLPFEMTLKYSQEEKIRYVWANRLFLEMAGCEKVQDIYDRTAHEVWKHIEGRGELVEGWDREVVQNGRFIHVDTLPYGIAGERHRLGIRFCIGSHTAARSGRIVFLASLGIDFSTLKQAKAACSAIQKGWLPASPTVRRKKRPHH
jgi:hypothetical protein